MRPGPENLTSDRPLVAVFCSNKSRHGILETSLEALSRSRAYAPISLSQNGTRPITMIAKPLTTCRLNQS